MSKPLDESRGRLSVVATPIGNLEDITLRALRTLKEADLIACEDTRVTKKLLSHFDIHTPVMSSHTRGAKAADAVIKALEAGKHVALACDAGTPGISDPGLELVSIVRERLPDVKIETVPGPSALSATLAIAGLRANEFTFYGFLPLKKGRETLFKEIAANPRASIFYESTHRIMKALDSLTAHLSAGRRVGVFRELTKLYEEALVGTASDVRARLAEEPQKQRGEFVVIVEAAD